MYRKYYNEYEKKAEQIRKEATRIQPVEQHRPVYTEPVISDSKGSTFSGFFEKFNPDDIILLAVIFVLMQEQNKDKVLLIILGYLFISGF